ncbi:MAG TPA: response regulator [Magnetospirillaceae bacterium]|jgi:CheY-like chemotaxis protein
MAPPNFENVNVILAEPKAEMGNVINAALFSRGLREFSVCRDFEGLRDALENQTVDVLLCDIELPGLKFRETMQRIRHNEIGRNPFLHIVAMVSLSGRDQVQSLIGAGVDDLIRKPMTPGKISQRFDNLARPRKPFVVGEEYIGPNRRKALRRGDGFSFVNVPNSLRCKTVDSMHVTQIRQQVARAWRDVSEKQGSYKQDAINTLTTRIMTYYDGRGTEEDLRRDLGYLVSKTETIINRYRNSETAHVAEIAACMTGVARRIIQSPTRPLKTDLRLMPHLSTATRQSALSPDEAVEAVREITMLIRDYLGL